VRERIVTGKDDAPMPSNVRATPSAARSKRAVNQNVDLRPARSPPDFSTHQFNEALEIESPSPFREFDRRRTVA